MRLFEDELRLPLFGICPEEISELI